MRDKDGCERVACDRVVCMCLKRVGCVCVCVKGCVCERVVCEKGV